MRARSPLVGEFSTDPRDAWAPVLLPVSSAGPLHTRKAEHLRTAIDGLGYSQTEHWDGGLRVADSFSRSNEIIDDVARYARIPVAAVPDYIEARIAELHSLFGQSSLPVLLDQLFRERYLDFTTRGQPPELAPDASEILQAILQGQEPDVGDAMSLYSALRCVSTPSAAVRRAYELELRTAIGPPWARQIGFHMLADEVAVPVTYPPQPRMRSPYMGSWKQTKFAIAGETQPDVEPSMPITLTRSELAITSLAALGCTNVEIAKRIGVVEGTVRNHLSAAARKARVPEAGRNALTHHLFKEGVFFVTRQVQENGE